MEKIAYLFNADFEEKLVQKSFKTFESSKINQEFEYLIHWLDPEMPIYTQKNYSLEYRNKVSKITKSEFKTTTSGKVELFCQNFDQIDLVLKLSSKFETMKFLQKNNLITYDVEFIKNEDHLTIEGLYKSPFGVSGSGHYIYPRDKQKILKIINEYGHILKEPVLNRSKDFSSLFVNGEYIATYENYIDNRFQYKGSFFSPNNLFSEDIDKRYKNFMTTLIDYTGDYQGIMSIDGFLYNKNSEIHPCCEINARKTMGYVAYSIWKKYFTRCEYFKFLLFKNNFSKKKLDSFTCELDNGAILLSPKDNRFLIFCLGGEDFNELKLREKNLVSTLFDSI